jgi:drug/metabolite transporter (DMT)-like permease
MSKAVLSWSILIVLALVWGSSFILMKRGLEAFSSEEVAGLRIVMASLFLLPLILKHYKTDLKKHGWALLGMGLFGNLIPAFLFTEAETGISSSLTGMLNALTPLFTILLSVLIFKNKTNSLQMMGIVIGFGGAVLLMYFNEPVKPQQGTAAAENGILFCLMVVAATICYAISVNVIRRYLTQVNSVTATVWSFTFIGPLALAYLFIRTDFIQNIQLKENALPALGYISILGIVGSSLSVIAFNSLIKLSGAVFASSVTYLIPVVAILWGVFDGERVVWQQAAAMTAILGAIYLINKRKN